MRLTKHGNLIREMLLTRFGEEFYHWFLRKYGHKSVNGFDRLSFKYGMWIEDYLHYKFVLRKLRQIEVDQS